MEKKEVKESMIFQRANIFYQEWLQNLDAEQGLRVARIPGRWFAPPLDVVKINFDGAFSEEAHFFGIGVVIHNDKGEVMACLEKQI